MLENRSPLAGVYDPGVYGEFQNNPGVLLQERKMENILQIAAWPQTIDTVAADVQTELKLKKSIAPGQATQNGGVVVLPVAPLKFLLIGESEKLSPLATKYTADAAVCLDLSHSYIALRIAGSSGRTFLNRGMSLDLDETVFPVDSVAVTALDSISVLLHHADADIFDLYVPRAFARFAWQWMKETGLQFGLEIRRPA